MQKIPTVSIVIPAYNEEKYLPACLDALARQTVKPLEVIVVDNNSSDSTAAIARSYPFVKVVAERQQGKVFARNAGFNAAKGDIIGRIDADTIVRADWVERVATFFASHPVTAAITGRSDFYDAPLPRVADALFVGMYYHVQRLCTGILALWGANMAVHKRAWQAVRDDCLTLPDVQMDEDIDLSIHLYQHRLKTAYVNHLRVGASALRGDITPGKIFRYMETWPKNYMANHMYGRAATAFGLMLVSLAVALPIGAVYSLAKRKPQHRVAEAK